jgi:hypothetical protein
MRARYDRPLSGSVNGRGTAALPLYSTSGPKYNTPNAHLVGTWLHQEHKAMRARYDRPLAGSVKGRGTAPPHNVRTEVRYYTQCSPCRNLAPQGA